MVFLKDNTDTINHLLTTILNKEVIIKPLFIGSGIFCDDLMFGIYVNQLFHLKAEGKLAEILIKHGAIPWIYMPKKQNQTGSTYYQLPDNIY